MQILRQWVGKTEERMKEEHEQGYKKEKRNIVRKKGTKRER
jgi:hypothetical protein